MTAARDELRRLVEQLSAGRRILWPGTVVAEAE
jgi:hypothetical protein